MIIATEKLADNHKYIVVRDVINTEYIKIR